MKSRSDPGRADPYSREQDKQTDNGSTELNCRICGELDTCGNLSIRPKDQWNGTGDPMSVVFFCDLLRSKGGGRYAPSWTWKAS